MISTELHRKRAIVTGGGSGIGRAICLSLAEAGANVAILDIDFNAASHVASQIRTLSAEALPVRASVSDPEAIAKAFTEIDGQWGGVDILINNAGVSANKPSLDLAQRDWLRVIDINLNGVFYCCQEAGRRMVDQGFGSVVNIGSIYSIVAAPNRLAYCATKAAVGMMTKVLAVEWAQSGIRVNAIAPGYVNTQLTAELVEQGRLDLAAIAKRTPFSRLATPEEIADAVLFLVSEKAAFITGQVLAVDGGWTAYGYV
jgi:NAD(P)-dependent dehydrogenase (short-subunit alcohol dehydrogenase family)